MAEIQIGYNFNNLRQNLNWTDTDGRLKLIKQFPNLTRETGMSEINQFVRVHVSVLPNKDIPT